MNSGGKEKEQDFNTYSLRKGKHTDTNSICGVLVN